MDWSAIYMRNVFESGPFIAGFAVAVLPSRRLPPGFLPMVLWRRIRRVGSLAFCCAAWPQESLSCSSLHPTLCH